MRIIIELDSGGLPEVRQESGQDASAEPAPKATDAGRFGGAPAPDADVQMTSAEATPGATDAGIFAGAPGPDQGYAASGIPGASADDAAGDPTPAGAAPTISDEIPMPRFTAAGPSGDGRGRP
ncbi:MAG: hypothetical protein WAL27_04610 [Cellulosimicrobium cellulans]